MRVFPSVVPVQNSSSVLSVTYSCSNLFSENSSLESAELKSGIIVTADFSMPVVKLVYLVLSVRLLLVVINLKPKNGIS